MKLRPGSTYSQADISQDERGFILRQHVRVGRTVKQIGKVKRFGSEEKMLLEMARRIDERLAQIGREKLR